MHTATQSKSEDKNEPLAAGDYLWQRPNRFSAAWDLIFDNRKIASLSSPKSFGRMVYFDYCGETYSIKKGGVRHPGAEVHLMSSETPILTLKQINIHDTIISGNGAECILKRKESSNEWALISEDAVLFTGVRDLTGKTPVGNICLMQELPSYTLAAAWFMIFMDEIP